MLDISPFPFCYQNLKTPTNIPEIWHFVVVLLYPFCKLGLPKFVTANIRFHLIGMNLRYMNLNLRVKIIWYKPDNGITNHQDTKRLCEKCSGVSIEDCFLIQCWRVKNTLSIELHACKKFLIAAVVVYTLLHCHAEGSHLSSRYRRWHQN